MKIRNIEPIISKETLAGLTQIVESNRKLAKQFAASTEGLHKFAAQQERWAEIGREARNKQALFVGSLIIKLRAYTSGDKLRTALSRRLSELRRVAKGCRF